MRKGMALCSLALLMTILANLNLYYRITVDGNTLEGLYSGAAVDRCEALAMSTAEEILEGRAQAPSLRRTRQFSFRAPNGDEAVLTDAILRAISGVAVVDSVSVNGVQLGTVEDGRLLFDKLRASIRGQMPNAAVVGNLSGELQIQTVYSRSGQETNYDDMILLITGMAPVIYVDGQGRLV